MIRTGANINRQQEIGYLERASVDAIQELDAIKSDVLVIKDKIANVTSAKNSSEKELEELESLNRVLSEKKMLSDAIENSVVLASNYNRYLTNPQTIPQSQM